MVTECCKLSIGHDRHKTFHNYDLLIPAINLAANYLRSNSLFHSENAKGSNEYITLISENFLQPSLA